MGARDGKIYTKKQFLQYYGGYKEWNAASTQQNKSKLSASAKSFQPAVKPDNMTSSTFWGGLQQKIQKKTAPAGMDPSAFGGKSLKIKSNANAARERFLARKKAT